MRTHGWLVMATVAVLAMAGPGPWTALPQPAAAAPGDADAGQQVFEANCAMCHGPDATGMMGIHPSLRGAVQRLSLEGAYVTIRNGRATRPPMPAFDGRLSDEQIDDVVAYIASWPTSRRCLPVRAISDPISPRRAGTG